MLAANKALTTSIILSLLTKHRLRYLHIFSKNHAQIPVFDAYLYLFFDALLFAQVKKMKYAIRINTCFYKYKYA
jgi:hypothetical protein